MASCAVAGVVYAFGAPMPRSFESVGVDYAWFVGWAVVLAASGVLALVGSFWRGRVDLALELERAGLTGNVGALLLYVTVAFVWLGWGGFVPAGFVGAWAVANLVRAVRLSRNLRALKARRAGGRSTA